MKDIDLLWAEACLGDREAFVDWMGRVERPIHRSLARYARAVDTESVVQEALLRMWHLSKQDGGSLSGENASLRWCIGITRNLARNLARRHRREHLLPEEDMPEGDDGAAPPLPDPFLRELIQRCIEALPAALKRAILVRIELGHRLAAEQAQRARMTVNTFHQNVTRARRGLDACLETSGVREHEAFR